MKYVLCRRADEVFLNQELSSGEPPSDASTRATPIAWEKLLVDAAVVGGRDRWFRRLRGLEQEFRFQISGLKDENPTERERLDRQLDRLQNLEQFALPLIEIHYRLPPTGMSGSITSETLLPDRCETLISVLALLKKLEPMSEVGPVRIDEVISVLA